MKKFDRAAAAYGKSGFIKTSVKGDFPEKTKAHIPEEKIKPESGKPNGYLKAAKFLLLIGPDQAAEVLKKFPPEDIEKIAREIAQVRRVGRGESESLLSEFSGMRPEKFTRWNPAADEIISGGPERAREMLITALGSEKGEALFDKVLPFGGRKPFDFFDDLQPEQILTVLKNEPPYVLSTVLSFLEPKLSSKILAGMPAHSRKEIVIRIARQGKLAPGVIEKMETVFRERIRMQGRVVTEEIDGKSVLAGILKHMDLKSEEQILEVITDENRELADEIKKNIYTVELLLKMDDKDVQYLLRDFENSELAVIIKGKSDSIREKILGNISERRRILVEEESVHLGEMLRSDVDKSTRELIEYLKILEQRGTIAVPRGDEEWI